MKIKNVSTMFALVAAVTAPTALAQQSTAPGLADKVKGLFAQPKEDELIEPDLAFKLSVVAKNTNVLHVEVVPANGYYVYKERMRFSIEDGSGVRIKDVKFPGGEMKNDQIFGRTEVFRKTVPVALTLENAAKGKPITLQASYQGCHEKLGVCYPPIDKTVQLTLP
ncbi:MAG TPA: protein-disulfide reductase DsbD N-terminal domain-containing protein [Noviherbaspirillum sp.]|uniref:protein-disulfide reductase DsbD N-terminal domain-containing protein n=1 Tax=Noviherbaspirillum sp. TaxID=1926288 RepID=UPI002D54763D|nr:protein-disulfide reductase DsbD N-terminal domain-containing protein [Noviherbaspirillum sp.]HYD96488.1 protein-disulfide reductase DsbD N-terminal domain-containing protein [Noviherbaspirillum sp.]